jgi:hypothetical protein
MVTAHDMWYLSKDAPIVVKDAKTLKHGTLTVERK